MESVSLVGNLLAIRRNIFYVALPLGRRHEVPKMSGSTLSAACKILALAAGLVIVGSGAHYASAQTTLLNVSYDPTRELYRDINALFAADWEAKTGENPTILM